MNREIKFRAWNPKLKVFTYFDIHAVEYIWKGEVSQFTGLKDKNGVEIYEGDIVMWKDDSPNPNFWRYAKVEYYTKRAQYCFIIIKCGVLPIGYMFAGETSFGGYNELEIIGNIYSNPELINNNLTK